VSIGHPVERRTGDVIGRVVRNQHRAAQRTLQPLHRRRHPSHRPTLWCRSRAHNQPLGAQKAFELQRFGDLIAKTAYVSEVGLDGTSRVPMLTQQATFDSILKVLRTPSPDREHPQLRGYRGCPRLPAAPGQ
jgi:hypothetical protein